jgi:deaminated glutathione amidase
MRSGVVTIMTSAPRTAQHLVAVAQMNASDDVEANHQVVAALCSDAARAGAQLLLLPECFALFARHDGDAARLAEPLDGPWFARYRSLAQQHRLWLSCGGFPERAPDDRCYNAHVLVGPDGQVAAHYRKIHLFDVDVGGHRYRESTATAAGDVGCVVDTLMGLLGLTVCYDIRFPELYRNLAAAGADALFVPAAFTLATGKEHWEPLLRARAIENQCYVLAAAQTGRHNDKRDTYGHAMIIDPWGTIIAQCRDGVGIATAMMDLAWVDAVRARMPCAQHRRVDAYARTAVTTVDR